MLETKKVSEEPTLPLLVHFVRSFLCAPGGLKFFLHSVYSKAFLTTQNTMRIAHKDSEEPNIPLLVLDVVIRLCALTR